MSSLELGQLRSGPPAASTDDQALALTGVRAILAWWVVTLHFGLELVSWAPARTVLGAGYIAVDVFFVLSGFVLARRYADDVFATWASRKEFWRRRFARLYPLYVVSLFVGIMAGAPRTTEALLAWPGLKRIAEQLLLLNAWDHRAMFAHNWAAWSLSAEAFFYLLFPWLLPWVRVLSVGRRRTLLGVCWLAVLIAPTLYMRLNPDHLSAPLAMGDDALWSYYLMFHPFLHVPLFVAGICAALLSARPNSGNASTLALTLGLRSRRWAAGISTVTVVGILVGGGVPYTYLVSGALLPLVVLLIVGLDAGRRAQPETSRPSWLAWGPLVTLGHASYATYILHVPVFWLLVRHVPDAWESPAWVIAYLVAMLPISLVAWRFIEEPLRRRLSA
jgi:peptidoglycan/LPS O-acetylase OafA/YrhL